MIEIITVGGLLFLGLYLTKETNPLLNSTLPPVSEKKGTEILRNFAFVSSRTGLSIFKDVGGVEIPAYGYGRDEIASVPYRVYLGKATGKYKNGMLEIATTINTKKIIFWAKAKDVKLLSKEEFEQRKNDEILEKPDSLISKLLRL